jgi:hypothetical protein
LNEKEEHQQHIMSLRMVASQLLLQRPTVQRQLITRAPAVTRRSMAGKAVAAPSSASLVNSWYKM